MKKKKILGLTLAGMTALTGGFMLAGCDLKIQKDSTSQEQEMPAEKTISGISISASAVPKYIVKGRFDQAKIKAMVTYSDNSFEYITVTEDLLSNADKAKVQTAGTHSITVTYEGKTETISIKVVTEMGLLQELANDLLEKDFTVTGQGTGAGNKNLITYLTYDADSKIMKYAQTDGADYSLEAYVWANGEYIYDIDNVEVEGNGEVIYKYKSSFEEYVKGEHLPVSNDILHGTGEFSNPQVTVDENNNYVYTVTWTDSDDPSETDEYKYVYNNEGIIKFEHIDYGYNFDTETSVNLTVPDKYRALESSAVEE